MSDVLAQLRALTKQGEDYIWRPAKAAVDEIERLRAERDELRHDIERHVQIATDLANEPRLPPIDELPLEVIMAVWRASGRRFTSELDNVKGGLRALREWLLAEDRPEGSPELERARQLAAASTDKRWGQQLIIDAIARQRE